MAIFHKLILFIVLAITPVSALKAENPDGDNERSQPVKAKIYGGAGFVFGAGATEFFEIYQSELSGAKNSLKAYSIIVAGSIMEINETYKARLSAAFFSAQMQDSYETWGDGGFDDLNRRYGQEFNTTVIPLILSLDYYPFPTRYRTYVGGGFGVFYQDVFWDEFVWSNDPRDKRVGGVHVDDTFFKPAIKIYAGTELRFDKPNNETFLGSLLLEASFTYSFGEIDVFENVRRQYDEPPKRLSEKTPIIPAFLSLTAAISFNFEGKRK